MDQATSDCPPPPRKGDLLFRDDMRDFHNNACLNVVAGGDQVAYSEGYRLGAQLLVRHVDQTATDQDYLVYPVIFLYRHHIELALKSIILRAPYLVGRQLNEAERKHLGTHRLDLLWQDLKPLLADLCREVRWQVPDPADIEGVDDYIRQLVEMDPDSYRFRYAHSKKGELSLPPELKRINLRHFAELMERLAKYLDELDTALWHIQEAKDEIEAYLQSEAAGCLDWGY